MNILDRYLTRQLLAPVLVCLFTIIFLVFVSDIFDHIDQMIKNSTPILLVVKYYLALLPQTFVSSISWACLLGTIYLFTTFNYHNEMTAMKVTGLEITSIIRPLLFVGFLVGILTFIVGDQLVPRTSQLASQILAEHIEKKTKKNKTEDGVYENAAYYGGRNRLYYARELRTREKEMRDFIILWLTPNRTVEKKTVAQRAFWNGAGWKLLHVTDYNMEKDGSILGEPRYRESAFYPEITESPEEFRRAASERAFISYRDLKEHIKKLKENGVKLSTEMVSLHSKLSTPWYSLIVMFLCVPILAKTSTRKLIALQVLVCISVIFFFHVSSAVILALGKAEKIMPLLSAWASSFIFGIGALLFLDRANH